MTERISSHKIRKLLLKKSLFSTYIKMSNTKEIELEEKMNKIRRSRDRINKIIELKLKTIANITE